MKFIALADFFAWICVVCHLSSIAAFYVINKWIIPSNTIPPQRAPYGIEGYLRENPLYVPLVLLAKIGAHGSPVAALLAVGFLALAAIQRFSA